MNFRNILISAAVAASIPTTAVAETTNLLFNSFLAPEHPTTRLVAKPWAEKVAEVTDGRVVVDLAPATLAAPHQQLNGVKNGVFDISYQFHGLMEREIKLNQIAHLPFVNTSSRGSSVALWRTYKEYFKEANELKDVHVLGMFVLPPGVIYGMNGPVAGVSDLKGKRVFALPGVPAKVMESAGAGVVAAPAARSYEAISGRVVDEFAGYSVSDAAGLKTLPYTTDITDIPGHLTAPSFVMFINKDRWNRLSQADRDAINSISGEAFAQSMKVYDDLEASVRADAKSQGVNFHVADDAFVADIEKLAEPIIDAWKSDAEAAGLDADAVISFYKDSAEAYK